MTLLTMKYIRQITEELMGEIILNMIVNGGMIRL
jgi:hypothetical protein